MGAQGEVFDQLVEVMQRVGSDIHAATAELDLTPMQGMLLDLLADDVAAPQNELARRMHCDASNLTGLVDALEGKGLIRRTTPPEDRRVRALVTTDAGKALRRRLHARLHDQSPILRRLSTTETDQLSALLGRLLQD